MTGITYRSDLTRNLSASEVDGNFLQLTQNKVETSVYSALAASVLALAAISGASAGTTQLTAGTLVFSDSNGVSWGLDGATLTASVKTDYLTTAALSAHSHGNPTLVLTNLSGTTASNSAGLTLSLSAAAPGAGAAISAAGSSQSGGTIVFSNSNGLSFGMNGSTVTGSHNGLTTAALSNHSHGNPTLALTNLSGSTASASNGLTISLSAAPPDGIGISAAAGSQTATSGTINFANSNGISFGMSGSSQITASYTVPETSAFLTTAALSNHSHGNPSLALTNLTGTTASNSAGLTLSLSAAAQTIQTQGSVLVQGSSGPVVFSNSNGITFGGNASTITASHNGLTSQSNQAVSAGNGSSAFQTLSFADGGGISWSTVAGGLQGTVKTDYLTTAALSNHSHGNPTLALTNLSGTTASASNGLTISLSAAAAGGGGIAAAAGTQTGTSGTINFANSNGITFGMSGSSQITASYSVPSTAGLLSAINVSGGTTSNNLSALTFSNGNGVTFGLDGSTITASVAAVAGAQTGISGLANSQTTFTSGTVSLSELGAITIRSTTGNQFQISVNPQSVQTQSLIAALYDGAASISTGTVRLSNANGITFGINGQTLTASHNALTSQSNQAVSAANGSSAFQTLSMADGGGVSWSTVAGGLQATVKTDYLTTAAVSNHSHGNPTLALTNISGTTASASNGLTLSLSAAATVAQTAQTMGLYASSQTYGQSSSSTLDARSLSIVGSGGVSVGMSAGSLLISGQTTAAQTAFVFSNSNNVSFGTNGSTVTATATFAQSAQTQSNVQGVIVSNTTYRTGDVSFSNANGISFGSSAGQAITASYTVPSTAGLLSAVNLSAGTTSNNLSAMVFSNSNGISFGLNGSTVTAAHNALTTARASNDAIGLNTAKTNVTWTVNSSGISFDAGGYAGTGFTSTTTAGTAIVATNNTAGLSLAFPTIVTNALTTARASNDAIGLATAQTNVTWTVNSAGLSLNAAGYAGTGTSVTGNAALTLNSNGLQFNGASLAGTSTGFTGANISASLTHNSAGLAMSMSVAPAGAATLTAYAVSNTTQSTSGTIPGSVLSFQANGGISVGISNGSVVLSGPDLSSLSATGALSASSNGSTISLGVGTVTASIIGNTTQTSTGTINLNGLVFSGAGGASLGISAGSIIVSGGAGAGGMGISAGTQSVSTGTMVFSNSNGVTFGMSGSSRITASVETSYAASNHSHGNPTLALTNLTGTTASASNGLTISLSAAAPGAGGGVGLSAGTQSVSTGTVVFSNSNGITFGMSGSSQVTASYNSTQFAGTGTTFAGANASASMTLNSAGLNLSFSVAAPGAAAEGNNHNLLGNNTAGNTTASGSTIGLSGLNLTLSGTNGSQIVLSAPATSSLVGASGVSISTNGSTISVYQPLISYYANGVPYLLNSQTQRVLQSTSIVFPVQIREGVTLGFMRMAHTISLASTSFASTGNTSYSYQQAETHNIVVYTLGTGANSMSLQSISSGSVGLTFSIRGSQNTTNNISVTHGLTYGVSNGTSSLSFSYAATNSTLQFSTSHMTALSGMKLWDTQFGASLLPGRYFVAYGVSTDQTTQQTANLSGARIVHSHIGMSQPNNTLGLFGIANSASVQWQQGMGSYTNAAQTTASIALSLISSSASHVVPYVQFINNA